jgi:hypothetical protein
VSRTQVRQKLLTTLSFFRITKSVSLDFHRPLAAIGLETKATPV